MDTDTSIIDNTITNTMNNTNNPSSLPLNTSTALDAPPPSSVSNVPPSTNPPTHKFFPTTRLKRLMQRNKHIGKMTASVPQMVGKATELFLKCLVERLVSDSRMILRNRRILNDGRTGEEGERVEVEVEVEGVIGEEGGDGMRIMLSPLLMKYTAIHSAELAFLSATVLRSVSLSLSSSSSSSSSGGETGTGEGGTEGLVLASIIVPSSSTNTTSSSSSNTGGKKRRSTIQIHDNINTINTESEHESEEDSSVKKKKRKVKRTKRSVSSADTTPGVSADTIPEETKEEDQEQKPSPSSAIPSITATQLLLEEDDEYD